MGKVISGLKQLSPIYKVVLGLVLLGQVINIGGQFIGTLSSYKLVSISLLCTALSLVLLAYNAKVVLKANRLVASCLLFAFLTAVMAGVFFAV